MVFGCIDYIANLLPPHCPCVGSKGRAAGPQASGDRLCSPASLYVVRSLNLTRSIRSNQPRARIRRPALTEPCQKRRLPHGGSRRTSCACPKRVLDKPTHIHARGLTPAHIQGCQSTDLNEYSSLDQVPSNFMEVETSCDVAKYARLTEPGAVAGSGQVVVVRTSHHGVPRPNQGLP